MSMLKRVALAVMVFVALLGFTLGSATAQGRPVVLRFAHMNSTEDAVHKGALLLKEYVEERTGGAIQIQIFPSGQLGENKEALEQARFGGNIIGQFGLGNFAEYVPDYSIFLGPFLFNSWDEALSLTKSDLVRGWEQQLEQKAGIKVLAYALFGIRDLYMIDQPVRTVADVRGKKIRVQPVKMYLEMIKAMGASPTPIPWPEVYSALAQGVVDGAEAPPGSIVDQKHYEVAKYLTLTNHMLDTVPIAMSLDWYNRLTPEQQEIIVEGSRLAAELITRLNQELRDESLEHLRAAGVQIIEDVDLESFRSATAKVYTQFPEWTPGLYENIQRLLGR